MNTSLSKQGDVGSKLPAMKPQATWKAGAHVEAGWTVSAHHGGGYAYRLAPADDPLTEETFRKMPLDFVGKSILRWGGDKSTQLEFDSLAKGWQTSVGTTPKGSMWRKFPIPTVLWQREGPVHSPPAPPCSCRPNRRGAAPAAVVPAAPAPPFPSLPAAGCRLPASRAARDRARGIPARKRRTYPGCGCGWWRRCFLVCRWWRQALVRTRVRRVGRVQAARLPVPRLQLDVRPHCLCGVALMRRWATRAWPAARCQRCSPAALPRPSALTPPGARLEHCHGRLR